MKICKLDGCAKKAVGHGYCDPHYRSFIKQNPQSKRKFYDPVCSVDGCSGKHKGKGLCGKHLARLRRHGTTADKIGTQRGDVATFLESLLDVSSADCIIWPYATTIHGYGCFRKDGKTISAHRAACEILNGKPQKLKNDAAHLCGNKLCVNPRHIVWASRSENNMHKVLHGTTTRGEKNNYAKLKEADVLYIRESADHQSVLASQYGVTVRTIRDVRGRRSWAWL